MADEGCLLDTLNAEIEKEIEVNQVLLRDAVQEAMEMEAIGLIKPGEENRAIGKIKNNLDLNFVNMSSLDRDRLLT